MGEELMKLLEEMAREKFEIAKEDVGLKDRDLSGYILGYMMGAVDAMDAMGVLEETVLQ